MIADIHGIMAEEGIVTQPFTGTLPHSGTGYLYPVLHDYPITTFTDHGRHGVLIQLTITDNQGIERDSCFVIFSRYTDPNSILGFGGDSNLYWSSAIHRSSENRFLARLRELLRGEQIESWGADREQSSVLPIPTDMFSVRKSMMHLTNSRVVDESIAA
jgi:hypothetical protein